MLKYFVADAFAEAPFEGNPAGVCVLDEWIPMEKMAKIAMENNLSETGFAVKVSSDPCTYELRWFTPVGEIDLCGHCTFGTAYILFRFFEQENDVIHFNTLKCGYHLVVEKQGDRLLLLSENTLELRQFNEKNVMDDWEHSSVRAWLNDEFFTLAFSELERSVILETTISNGTNPRKQMLPGVCAFKGTMRRGDPRIARRHRQSPDNGPPRVSAPTMAAVHSRRGGYHPPAQDRAKKE